MDDSAAYFELKVTQTIDAGTHYLFIGEVINCEIIDNNLTPITYDYYRKVRKAVSPKNAPTYIDESKFQHEKTDPDAKMYKCSVAVIFMMKLLRK